MTRTIEVVPKKNSPLGTHSGWMVRGTGMQSTHYKKKKKALKSARQIAKQDANKHNHSVEVKIFGKDGEWQREQVYKPNKGR